MRPGRPLIWHQAWLLCTTVLAATSATTVMPIHRSNRARHGISSALKAEVGGDSHFLPLEHVGPKRNVGGMFDPDLLA